MIVVKIESKMAAVAVRLWRFVVAFMSGSWYRRSGLGTGPSLFRSLSLSTRTREYEYECNLDLVSTNPRSGSSRRMADKTERSFIMVKPDGVERGLVGEIVKRFEQRGYKLVAMKFMQVDMARAYSYSVLFMSCM